MTGGTNELEPGIAILKPFGADPTFDIGYRQAFWSEVVLTSWFVTIVMSVKYLNGANDLFLNALTVGLTVYTVVCIGGGISGGCFNPAVGIAQIAF
jgi:glycerol uptake facilitator-like aquaporin